LSSYSSFTYLLSVFPFPEKTLNCLSPHYLPIVFSIIWFCSLFIQLFNFQRAFCCFEACVSRQLLYITTPSRFCQYLFSSFLFFLSHWLLLGDSSVILSFFLPFCQLLFLFFFLLWCYDLCFTLATIAFFFYSHYNTISTKSLVPMFQF